jgi:addiction module HigA family antidote
MTQSIINQYQPNVVSPPGETLLETLQERAITVEELAAKMESSERAIASLISGNAPLTPEIALQLEQFLGIPAHFWNNRERHYRDSLARSQPPALADELG